MLKCRAGSRCPRADVRRFVASQLRHRPSRVLALGVAIVAASASFILLAAAAKTGGLKVTGSVKSSFRPAYDVLVRPEGSKTSLERTRGLVATTTSRASSAGLA